MSYTIAGLLGALINIIINRFVLFHNEKEINVPAKKEYRAFLLGVLVFFTTDALWGFTDSLGVVAPLFAVTSIFFLVMTATVFLWTRYVTAYIGAESRFAAVLKYTGLTLEWLVSGVVVLNLFVPVMFTIDGQGNYHAGPLRYAVYISQLVLFFLSSGYTLVITLRTDGQQKSRYRTVWVFGFAMIALIFIQLFYPLLPLYSIGFLLGICLIHSFVIEDAGHEYRKTLESMLKRDHEREVELGTAKRRIYTDPLTGVKSKQAYIEDAGRLNEKIKNGTAGEFGVAVFDLNDLKGINDTMGHDTGDIYIYRASMLISEFFTHSDNYRIGGDEFAVIITGDDYKKRADLLALFDRQCEKNLITGNVVVASGMADYRSGEDENYITVFERADRNMYRRKERLKKLQRQ